MSDDVTEVRELTEEVFEGTHHCHTINVEKLDNGQILVELARRWEGDEISAWQGFRLVPYVENGYIPTSVATKMAWFTPTETDMDLPVRNPIE
jgi:hypothetical protein